MGLTWRACVSLSPTFCKRRWACLLAGLQQTKCMLQLHTVRGLWFLHLTLARHSPFRNESLND